MKEALNKNKQFQQEQQVTHQFEHPVLFCQEQQVTHQFEHPMLHCLLLPPITYLSSHKQVL